MRFRHAAVLALTGWYLISPPSFGDGTFNLDAPLPQWTVWRSFDSAGKCEHDRSVLLEAAGDAKLDDKGAKQSMLKMLCVSADDIRLKGK